MFYVTQIKSVGQSGVIDVQGRRLNFIGYLPVKAGDSVYTDGNVIFGNAPPKGAPAIFNDEPSGIPVLGDEDSYGDELRGYFTINGKYKRFSIKGDDWIVNDKKKYAHDDGEDNIIDVEIIADDKGNENEFTVEKIIGDWTGEVPSDEFKCSIAETGERFGETTIDFTVNVANIGSKTKKFRTEKETWLRFITADKAEFAQKNGSVIKNCELIIKKNSEEFSRLNFSDLVKESEDRARDFISDFNVVGHPSEDEIETRAVLENFKIAADGHWEALLWIDVLAKRTFSAEEFVTLAGILINREGEEEPLTEENTAYIEDPTIIEMLYDNLHDFFASKFYKVTTTTTVKEFYTYTKPTYQSAVCTHHCFFVKLSSDTLNQETPSFEQEILFETMRYFPLYFITSEVHYPVEGVAETTFSEGNTHVYIDSAAIMSKFNFQAGRSDVGYPSLTWYKIEHAFVGTYTSIWEENVVSGWEVPGTASYSGETVAAVLIFRLYNSQDWLNVTDLDLKTERVTGRYIDGNIGCDREDDFLLHVQDDFQAKIITPSNKSWLYDTAGIWDFDCRLNDVRDADNKSVIGDFLSDEENAHKWNMSLVTLKDGAYLFGIHDDQSRDIDGKLYKISSDGQVEQVGDGLKNYRLRELKNNRKAKK